MIEMYFFLTLHVAGCELLLGPGVDLACGSALYIFSFQYPGWETLCGDSLFLFLWQRWRTRELVETHLHLKAFTQNWNVDRASPCSSQKPMDCDVLQGRCVTTACYLDQKYSVFLPFAIKLYSSPPLKKRSWASHSIPANVQNLGSYDSLPIRWSSGDLLKWNALTSNIESRDSDWQLQPTLPMERNVTWLGLYFAQPIVLLGAEIASLKEPSFLLYS